MFLDMYIIMLRSGGDALCSSFIQVRDESSQDAIKKLTAQQSFSDENCKLLIQHGHECECG